MHNDAVDNQDDLKDSEMMKIGYIKQSDTIWKLKDDKVYVLDSMGENFQDELLKNVLDHYKKDGEHNAKHFVIDKWSIRKNWNIE